MTETKAEAPLRTRLDIVQDCSDLRGTFSQNVELYFLYWKHGKADDGTLMAENSQKLAPYCIDADVIAVEVAGSVHKQPARVKKEFEIVNTAIKDATDRISDPDKFRNIPRKSIDERYGSLPQSAIWHCCVGLFNEILALKGGNLKKAPIFTPIDVMGEPAGPTSPDEWQGFMHYVTNRAKRLREREAVVIRQLHAEAHELAADGQEHQIAIIYGSAHSAVSVATRELGAKTKRVFIDPGLYTPMDYASRLMRYEGDSADQLQQLEEAKRQSLLGSSLLKLSEYLGVVPESSGSIELMNRLMTLNMRAAHGALVSSDLKKYNEAMKVAEALFKEKTAAAHMPRKKKRAYRVALKTLIDLSSDIS